jgi:hypothetical protein
MTIQLQHAGTRHQLRRHSVDHRDIHRQRGAEPHPDQARQPRRMNINQLIFRTLPFGYLARVPLCLETPCLYIW